MTTQSTRIACAMLLVVSLVGAGWSDARAAEKVTVGIGGVALMVYLPTVLAKDKGYFAEEGSTSRSSTSRGAARRPPRR